MSVEFCQFNKWLVRQKNCTDPTRFLCIIITSNNDDVIKKQKAETSVIDPVHF